MDKLVAKGTDVRTRRQNGWTALHAAANSAHAVNAGHMIVHGVDNEAIDADSM